MEQLMKAFRQFFREEDCQGFTEEVLLKMVASLEPREAKILELRFGLNGQGVHTLREAGSLIGKSHERVRQIQYCALRKLYREYDRLLLGKGVKNQDDVLLLPTRYLNLNVYARKCCNRLDIKTVGELVQKSKDELLGTRNFGPISLVKLEEELARFNLTLKERNESNPMGVEGVEDPLSLPISHLEFGVRERKCCNRLGVQTVGELIKRTADDLLETKNFGAISLRRVREKLAQIGLKLKGD